MFKCDWPQPPGQWEAPDLATEFQLLRSVRATCNKALDMARSDKVVRSSLEANVHLATDSDALYSLLAKYEKLSENQFNLSDIFIVSGLTVSTNRISDAPQGHSYVDTVSVDGTEVKVQATAVCTDSTVFKCPRCWKYISSSENCLCARCVSVVENIS